MPEDSADAIPPKTSSAANSPIAARIDTYLPWLRNAAIVGDRDAPSMLRTFPTYAALRQPSDDSYKNADQVQGQDSDSLGMAESLAGRSVRC